MAFIFSFQKLLTLKKLHIRFASQDDLAILIRAAGAENQISLFQVFIAKLQLGRNGVTDKNRRRKINLIAHGNPARRRNVIVHFGHDGRNKSDQQGAVGDTVLEKGCFGKLLVDVDTVMVTGNPCKQMNVGFGYGFGETFFCANLKIIQGYGTSFQTDRYT